MESIALRSSFDHSECVELGNSQSESLMWRRHSRLRALYKNFSTENPMVVLAVTWIANDGHDSDVARLFKTLESESRKELGCLVYIVHRHKTDHRRFFIYEQYKDDDAMEAHRNSPHFQKYAAGELPKIATRSEAEFYKPLDNI